MRKSRRILLARSWTIIAFILFCVYFFAGREWVRENAAIPANAADIAVIVFSFLITVVTRRGLSDRDVQFWGQPKHEEGAHKNDGEPDG